MVQDIDNIENMKKGFIELEKEYLVGYTREVQDPDLEAEFDNQIQNMKSNVSDLTVQLKSIKSKHAKAIIENRENNEHLIKSINEKKNEITEKTKRNKEEITTRRHATAVAANIAKKNLKYLDEIEFESPEEKIKYLTELVEEKRNKLRKLTNQIVLPNLNNYDNDS